MVLVEKITVFHPLDTSSWDWSQEGPVLLWSLFEPWWWLRFKLGMWGKSEVRAHMLKIFYVASGSF